MSMESMKVTNDVKAKLTIMGFDTRPLLIRVSGSSVMISGKLAKLKGGDCSRRAKEKYMREIETMLRNIKGIMMVRFDLDKD